MKISIRSPRKIIATLFIGLFFAGLCLQVTARAGGGGGGHGGGGGGGGGGGFGGGGFGGGYHGGGGGGDASLPLIIGFIVVIIIVSAVRSASKGTNTAAAMANQQASQPFPDGLTPDKVKNSFVSIQQAWQNKNLKEVRRWISDGIYQRYTVQFAIMNKLEQVNRLSNIRVNDIRVVGAHKDAAYEVADVAISFTIDDEFRSAKYPVFDESFMNDSDVEYWSFIRKQASPGSPVGKDLYSNDNCPNCGAPMDIKMGEICRCSSCGTLANNATYDWVLSEITQQDDWGMHEQGQSDYTALYQQMQADGLFAIQRMEDVASNVFMQIMDVMTGGDAKRLTRFADKDTVAAILGFRNAGQSFLFDRLYLNAVTIVENKMTNGRVDINFILFATYQKVTIGQQLRFIDKEMMEHAFSMTLSRNVSGLKANARETVFSYECPCCGAPYTDTTDATCTYCGEAVINLNNSWVLTSFEPKAFKRGDSEDDNG